MSNSMFRTNEDIQSAPTRIMRTMSAIANENTAILKISGEIRYPSESCKGSLPWSQICSHIQPGHQKIATSREYSSVKTSTYIQLPKWMGVSKKNCQRNYNVYRAGSSRDGTGCSRVDVDDCWRCRKSSRIHVKNSLTCA